MKNQAYRMALLYDFYGDMLTDRQKAVSYTHLDVYKRQGQAQEHAGAVDELSGGDVAGAAHALRPDIDPVRLHIEDVYKRQVYQYPVPQ